MGLVWLRWPEAGGCGAWEEMFSQETWERQRGNGSCCPPPRPWEGLWETGLWPLLLSLACLDRQLLIGQIVFRTVDEGEVIGAEGTVGAEMCQ